MREELTDKILESLKRGDKATLEKIYIDNRVASINFSKKFDLAHVDAVDVYQDTIFFIKMLENLHMGLKTMSM